MDLQELDKGEKAHQITTTVYKDLQLNFTQGLKAIWSSGKALHKSLEVTSQKAKAHYDAITILGQAASQSEGTVIGIGHALMQMAEIYKEIQNQVDENIAALKKDLCNPFEFILLDNSDKMEEKLKKYSKEHVKLFTPYKKAASNLHKHRKKGKGGIQNPKEMQYYREATECKQRLDSYRLKHLKDALFEEKTCYLYAFERLVTIAKNHAIHSSKTQELMGHRLVDWETLTQSKDLTKDALKIIESISDMVHSGQERSVSASKRGPDEEADNNNRSAQNGNAEFHTDSLSSNSGSGSLSRSTKDPLPELPAEAVATSEKPKVIALYNHEGDGDNQLTFREDDILLLHGNKRDGWHYGQNTRTKQYGWFPISFTESVQRNNSLGPPAASLTSSSMSKLSRSVADLTGDAPKHRLNFKFTNSGIEERSTMTLPHKRNVARPTVEIKHLPPSNLSQVVQLLCHSVTCPLGLSLLGQDCPGVATFANQLIRAQQWIASQYLEQGTGTDIHQPTGYSLPETSAISEHQQQYEQYLQQRTAYNAILQYNEQQLQRYHQQLADNSMCLASSSTGPSNNPLYNNTIPSSNLQDEPPLPPPPSDLHAGDTGESAAIRSQSSTMPMGFRRANSCIVPMSPPPPPPPNQSQTMTFTAGMGSPSCSQSSDGQSSPGSTIASMTVPPPPPISSIPAPHLHIPPPPPPMCSGVPPPPPIGSGVPPPPPLPP